MPSARKLVEMGFQLYASPGTADFLSEHDLPTITLDHIGDGEVCYSIHTYFKIKPNPFFGTLPTSY